MVDLESVFFFFLLRNEKKYSVFQDTLFITVLGFLEVQFMILISQFSDIQQSNIDGPWECNPYIIKNF